MNQRSLTRLLRLNSTTETVSACGVALPPRNICITLSQTCHLCTWCKHLLPMVINKHLSSLFTSSFYPQSSLYLLVSGCLSDHLQLPAFPLHSSPFSSLAPRGVCSLCAAIHQACHRSLRGGWRGLRGTRLISLLWLSRPAQRERAPATRAFAAPSSTSSSSSSSSHFSSVLMHLLPLQSVQLLHSPISSWLYFSPAQYTSVCMMYASPVCQCVNTRMHWECLFVSPKAAGKPEFHKKQEETIIKRALSGSMGFPDCLTTITVSSKTLLKDSPGGFWQLNKCGGEVLLWAAVKNVC